MELSPRSSVVIECLCPRGRVAGQLPTRKPLKVPDGPVESLHRYRSLGVGQETQGFN